MKYNVMPDAQFGQTGGARGHLSGTSGFDASKRATNGDVNSARSLGGPQYFVLDQQYVNNEEGIVS